MWQQLKQLGKQSAIYGLGNVATSILGFLLVPLYTHHLTPREFGVYSLLITAYSLLAVVVDCGMTNSLARYYFGDVQDADPGEQERYRQTLISTALAASTAFAVAIALLCFALSDWLAATLLQDATYAPYIRILAWALFFRGLTVAPLVYLRVTEKPLLFSALTTAQLALFLLLNIVLLVPFKMGVTGIFYSLLLSTALYAVGLLLAILRDLKPRFDVGVARELLAFGLPFLPVLLMMWVIDLSDRYLLGLYTTMTEVGIYSLGYKFGQCMTFVVTAFTMGWTPIRFKLLSMADPQIIYGRVATFYLAGAGLVWLMLALSAREIIALTSPAQFSRAAVFIAPVAMAYLIYGLFVLAVTGLGVAKKPASMPFIAVGAALLNIGLNIAFIPRFGAIAAAYATIVAYIALTLGSLYFSQQHYPINYQYRKMAGILAAILVLAGVGSLLPSWPLAIMMAVKTILLLLYIALTIATGVINRSEMANLLHLISRFSPSPLRSRLTRYAHSLQPPLTGGDVTP